MSMHPETVHALAAARIADLHREAAQERLARQVPTRTRQRPDLSSAGARVRGAVARWLPTRAAPQPQCCPA